MNQVINFNQAVKSVNAISKGLDSCPRPMDHPIVCAAMSAWGRYQWRNRDVDNAHGYPSINPLCVQWGLGNENGFDCEELMPPLAEISHNEVLLKLDPVAMVFAFLYWAHPSGSMSIRKVVSMANAILPYNVTRVNAETWLSAISGAVIAQFPDGVEYLVEPEQMDDDMELMRGVL